MLTLVLLVSLQLTTALAEPERAWLEEEVADIITDEERGLFVSLETGEERARFIEAFWRRRDPSPATEENEYRREHYRRLGVAKVRFGRTTTRRGAKTDRGRFYVILGEPDRIERIVGSNEVVDLEIWFYRGERSLSLPPRFHLIFFKEGNIGDYRIYSPIDDGPEALINAGVFLRDERDTSMDILEGVSLSLARASLSVDATDPVSDFIARPSFDPAARANPARPLPVQPSTSANLVLADILESPRRFVDTDYVEGYRRFGDRVSADYSFNYVAPRDYFTVLYEPDGTPFVHFGIEIDAADVGFRLDADGAKYRTVLRIDIEAVARGQGRVEVPPRDVEIEVLADQMESAFGRGFAYQDSVALVPGAYELTVTLRDLSGEHFTVVERSLTVTPLGEVAPFLAGGLLGYEAVPGGGGSFSVSGTTFSPAASGRFSRASHPRALLQVAGAREGDRLRVSLLGDEGALGSEDAGVLLSDAAGGSVKTVVQPLDIEGIVPGRYTVVFELLGSDGIASMTKSAGLEVVDEPVPRPALVYRHIRNAPEPQETAMTLVRQYLALGDLTGAETELRRRLPENRPETRWMLASVLLFSSRADEALELLSPLEGDYPDQIEVVEGLGFAHYLRGEWEEALFRFEHALALRPADTSILNATGDCYQKLGRPEKARRMFELSLGLEANQPGVRARLAELTER